MTFKDTTLLQNRRILLIVTGSIAAYKSLELVRLFTKAGASVRVSMSDAAQKFVTPLCFEALCGHGVLCENSESWASEQNHIAWARWAEAVVIAPATANTINKLSNGLCDNLPTQILLATRAPKILAPAANTMMLEHPTVQAGLKMLRLLDYDIVGSKSGVLACGEVGNGVMADVNEIFWHTARALLKDEFWAQRNVVVTGGGTREAIDDVRYIGNRSSGKMADALCLALFSLGARVCLVHTHEPRDLPNEIHTIEVESAHEMLEWTQKSLQSAKSAVMSAPTLMREGMPQSVSKTPYLFMAAAVADYLPQAARGKLKKESLGESWTLDMTQTVDILASIDKTGVKTVGFKAETDAQNAVENAKKALQNKGLDAICLNVIGQDTSFGADSSKITFLTSNDEKHSESGSKLSVAFWIARAAQTL